MLPVEKNTMCDAVSAVPPCFGTLLYFDILWFPLIICIQYFGSFFAWSTQKSVAIEHTSNSQLLIILKISRKKPAFAKNMAQQNAQFFIHIQMAYIFYPHPKSSTSQMLKSPIRTKADIDIWRISTSHIWTNIDLLTHEPHGILWSTI